MKFPQLPASPRLRLLLLGAGAGLILLLVAALSVSRLLNSPMPVDQAPTIVEVTPGSSLSRVANELDAAGLLSYPRLFILLARWQGVANSIKVGEYEIDPGMTPVQLLNKMVAGDTVQYRVTLVEGWTFARALDAIWASAKVRRELDDYDPVELVGLLELDAPGPEGMLFPDTYFYTKDTSDLELLRRAHQRLREVLEREWQTRLGALPYADPYEALIMASIIEKESAVGSERGHIAGVFVRRLERGMRLQSDPTVIYGMGETFAGDIRRGDLDTTSPYNTYRINGLPPTPIALAGLESIVASLHPLESDYLYFVARGDGSHQFSSTLEEHNAAVNRYQRQQDSL